MRFAILIALAICLLIIEACSPALPSAESRRVVRVNYEFTAGLKRRGIQQEFNNFKHYVGDLMDRSRAPQGSSEKTGKCRLRWVEELVREPLPALGQAEQFTRDLFTDIKTQSLTRVLQVAGKKLELKKADADAARESPAPDPLDRILQATKRARGNVQQAFRLLSKAEQQKLHEQLYPDSTANVSDGYRFADKRRATELIELLDRIDYVAMVRASEDLAAFLDDGAIKNVLNAEQNADILERRTNGECTVLVGGPGKNEYALDDMPNVCAIIDIGGDDLYIEGTVNKERPVLLVIDLQGNDTYRGERPGIQGSSIMGVSLLWDVEGNDTYKANDVAQGSTLAGVGILVDRSGNDSYTGDRRVQGQALGGIGLLIDSAGEDKYRGALLAQGVGAPRGFGLLTDLDGADQYFAGGKYLDSYEDSPGFGSWSQGIGVGIRGVAEGGIGTLLDGGGSDIYEADYFSHGGGYWFAAGFARDFAGNDRRIGATRVNFDGSSRKDPFFLRWGIGFTCHYSVGFVFDDKGNDTYSGDWAVIAYGWDVGIAAVCDFAGSDNYQSSGTGSAQARNVAVAILYDRSGRDLYRGEGLGDAEQQSQTHVNGKSRSSFALLLDDNGEDIFPSHFGNNRELRRTWAGGFFVDR